MPTNTPPVPSALRVETEEEVVERVADCRRCALRHDLIWAVRTLTRRCHRPARVFIELSGWADPAIAAQTLMRDPWLARLVMLDGFIAVVDAGALLVRAASGIRLWPTDEVADQVAVADVVVANRIRRLTPAARGLAIDLIREASRRAAVVVDDADGFDLDRLLGIGTLTRSAAEQASLFSRERDTFPPASSTGHLLEVLGEIDRERFDEWLVGLDHHTTCRLLRVAGILAIAGQECRVAFHRIGTSIHLERSDPWDGQPRVSRLFVAGRHLQAADLHSSLQGCVRA